MSQPNHDFARRLLDWFDHSGRKNLPWQHDTSAYRVWVSEIMLQQTQVNTVIPYYQKFMQSFPDVSALASAPDDEVMYHWSGLGYYSRARNLHKTAKLVVDEYDGEFPNDIDQLQMLPGIGRSTAGAICAIAFNAYTSILDGNVKRALARHRGIDGWPGQSQTSKQLWSAAEAFTPAKRTADYTQAIMDLGATVCTRSKPGCDSCPVSSDCVALSEDRIAELPGKKPKKSLPVKTTEMLLIENRCGEVLLKKRPPTGIWGGLWSLPEGGAFSDRLTMADKETWPSLRHTFSHFHLDITPIHYKQAEFNGVMDNDDMLWYNIARPQNIGLAAPVSKLLQHLARQRNAGHTRHSSKQELP